MRFLVSNVALWLDEPKEMLGAYSAKKLGVDRSALNSVRVVRSVLDARKRDHPRYVYTVEVDLPEGQIPKSLPSGVSKVLPEPPPLPPVKAPAHMPIIVGSGPAGLFCALGLLERGVRSIVLERGRDVHSRAKDVAKLMRDGSLDVDSNMAFGEGGAGTFTDGKLSTRVNHPYVRKVLDTFTRFGAPEHILVDGKPHIGSDLLPGTIEKLRNELIRNGCVVRFEAKVADLLYGDGSINGVLLADGSRIESDRVVLAIGSSSRELYERFANDKLVAIEAKAFAIGLRAEHPQALINAIQYGEKAAIDQRLPPADYKLVENLLSGNETRGVYSFCMCPGGIVVPTPTEPGHQCTNGMSNSKRNAKFANAGIVASVTLNDFMKAGFDGPLAGLTFQRHLERQAFKAGGEEFFAPAQSIPDFIAGRLKKNPGKTSYRPGVSHVDLSRLLPAPITECLRAALKRFDRKMRGFASDEGLLIGIESRTSAPVRIRRGENLQSISLAGLYPAGEGCGYAGGITSSAIDGLRIAEQICSELT